MSSEANELLPVYNKTCQRQYNTPLQTNDWSSQLHSSMFIRPFSTNSFQRMTQNLNNGAWKSLFNSGSAGGSSSYGSTSQSSRDVHYTATAATL